MPSRAGAAVSPDRRDGNDFSGQSLDGVNLTDRVISRANFDGASLKRAIIVRAEFRECTFMNANFDAAVLQRTVFENCDFSNAFITNANAQGAVFRATTILGYDNNSANFRKAKTILNGATLNDSSFVGARLVAASLHNIKAERVDFSHCDLRNSSFDGSTLNEVKFAGAKLQDANFAKCPDARSLLPEYALLIAKFVQPIAKVELDSYLASHLKWLDTDGAEGQRLCLQGFDLSGQKFDNHDFSGTDFRGARLDRASMKNVKLVAADLRDASLTGTDFSASDLRGALLSEGALRRSILNDALVGECVPPHA